MTDKYLPRQSIEDDFKLKLTYALKWSTFQTVVNVLQTLIQVSVSIHKTEPFQLTTISFYIILSITCAAAWFWDARSTHLLLFELSIAGYYMIFNIQSTSVSANSNNLVPWIIIVVTGILAHQCLCNNIWKHYRKSLLVFNLLNFVALFLGIHTRVAVSSGLELSIII